MSDTQQVIAAHYRAARRNGLPPLAAAKQVLAFCEVQLSLDPASPVLRDRERCAWQWRETVLVRDLRSVLRLIPGGAR
jgi:hypothetical protein